MDLFSDNFGIIKTDEELASLKSQFPSYDAAYIVQAAALSRQRVKAWMEKLWEQYKPYADNQFQEDFKRQFAQRSWELYLGTTLLNRGFKLGKHKDSEPDFDVISKDNDKRLCWIEAIAVEKGSGADRVPEIVYGLVASVPDDQMILRLSNALNKKFLQYKERLDKRIVKQQEPYVIAIDRSDLGHVDPGIPLILKTLFPIGDLTLRLRVGDKPVKNPENFWSTRTHINKKSGAAVPMLFFENKEHIGISAVIYSCDSILNSPRVSEQMGENFYIIHNPYSTNPLPDNFFPFGEEFKAQDGNVSRIRKQKKYTKPDPFDWIT